MQAFHAVLRPAVTTTVGHIVCLAASMVAVEVGSRSPGRGLHDPVPSFTIWDYLAFVRSLSHRPFVLDTGSHHSECDSFVCLSTGYYIIFGCQIMMTNKHGILARTTPVSALLVSPCSAPQTDGLGDAPLRTRKCEQRSRSAVCTCRYFASCSSFPQVFTGFTCFSRSQFTGLETRAHSCCPRRCFASHLPSTD